ncbi:Hypothetical predicted protein [Mytilus galloprovincialis]|uniref:Mutator-like transposase domain-containing protein n=1 Tax=Mytilus galloprovincialis TaxID=29158 RepID=A0A8B6CP50_MYTGA|nr:Hypothetical predicted protein [Mytilus galloprovincialis]
MAQLTLPSYTINKMADLKNCIVQQLKECSKCEEPLHLQNSLGVKPYGVAGILYVQYTECGDVARIRIGKTHYANKNKRGVGMIHAGIGETQLNNLLSTMNVHYPHHKSLNSRENEVGIIMEYQANASEMEFSLDETFQSMTIDADVAAGEKTGKIVNHTLRISGCRLCRNAPKKGGPPLPHNCRKNWSGTAKGHGTRHGSSVGEGCT